MILDIFTVVVSKKAKRDLQIVPVYIARKLGAWIDTVNHDGLQVTRKMAITMSPSKVIE
jgi:toxin HigB-1